MRYELANTWITYTYVQKYSDFLVVLISVGLTQTRLSNIINNMDIRRLAHFASEPFFILLFPACDCSVLGRYWSIEQGRRQDYWKGGYSAREIFKPRPFLDNHAHIYGRDRDLDLEYGR